MPTHDYSANVRPHSSPLVRWALVFVGSIFVIVGVAGVLLPLLPGTPFLLLGAACYARANRRFYNWLLNTRIVGPTLAEWRRSRRIPRDARRNAMIVVVIAFSVTVLFAARGLVPRIAYAALAVLILGILFKLPTAPEPGADEEGV